MRSDSAVSGGFRTSNYAVPHLDIPSLFRALLCRVSFIQENTVPGAVAADFLLHFLWLVESSLSFAHRVVDTDRLRCRYVYGEEQPAQALAHAQYHQQPVLAQPF